jgi:hypothetical protein
MSRSGVAIALVCAVLCAGCGQAGTDGTSSGSTTARAGQPRVDHAYLMLILRNGGLSPKAAECAIPRLLDSASRAEIARSDQEALFPLLAKAGLPCDRRYPGPPEISHHVSSKRIKQIARDPGLMRKLFKRRTAAAKREQAKHASP